MRETRLVLKLIGQGQGFEVRREDEKGFRIIGFLILFLVMIPACVAAGGLTYAMTLAFVLSGGKTEGLLFIIQFLSAFALVFGFSVIMNSFYFAGDIDILLPLPISPRSIITSKFIVTYLAESGMEFLVIISAWAGYLLAAGGGIKDIILCLFATFTLPVLPLAYCGILSILIMFFFSGFTNRKTMNFFLAALSIVLLVAAVLSFAGLEGLTIENFIDMLLQDKNRFMNIMNVVFYPGYILMKALSGGGGILILEYILINLFALLVFALLSDRLYMPGLMAFRSASDKKREVRYRKKSFRRHSPFFSLLRKEIRMLFRTPGYITNCLLINLFWPVIVVIILLMQKGSDTIARFIFTYHFGYILAHITMIMVCLFLALVTTAANSISATVITREGKNACFMKFIPVSYGKQLTIKAIVGVAISFISYLSDIIILRKVFLFSPKDTAFYIVIGLCMILSASCMGVAMDTRNPKLIWENEANAIRGNMNVFISMASVFLILIAFGLLSAACYFIEFFNRREIDSVFLAACLIVLIVSFSSARKRAVSNMEKLEL